jgi:hypothetical protein
MSWSLVEQYDCRFNVLQLVFGLIATAMAMLGLAAQRRGWSESIRLEADL